jgi:hypothetical protein
MPQFQRKHGGGRSPSPSKNTIPARPQALETTETEIQELSAPSAPQDFNQKVNTKSLDLKKAETGTSGA